MWSMYCSTQVVDITLLNIRVSWKMNSIQILKNYLVDLNSLTQNWTTPHLIFRHHTFSLIIKNILFNFSLNSIHVFHYKGCCLIQFMNINGTSYDPKSPHKNYASASDLSLAKKAAFLSVTYCLRWSQVSLALFHLLAVAGAGFFDFGWDGSARIAACAFL